MKINSTGMSMQQKNLGILVTQEELAELESAVSQYLCCITHRDVPTYHPKPGDTGHTLKIKSIYREILDLNRICKNPKNITQADWNRYFA